MDRSLDQVKPHRSHPPGCGVAGQMTEAVRLVQPVAAVNYLPGPMRDLRADRQRIHTAFDTEPTRCRAVPAGRMHWKTRSMSGNA